MDVFKILARSTNLAKGARTSEKQSKTPSAGRALNPQLFGQGDTAVEEIGHLDGEGRRTSRKRKRGTDAEGGSAAVPAELDFFGDTTNGTKGDKLGAGDLEKDAHGDHGAGGHPKLGTFAVQDMPGRWSEERCKLVLRSHKLKITLVGPYEAEEEAVDQQRTKRKEKKRKRKLEDRDGPAKKQPKPQLYPQPLTSFTQLRPRFGISRKLAENIQAQGYETPTEVQLGSLPLLLGQYDALSNVAKAEGEDAGTVGERKLKATPAAQPDVDLLTIAPTGSGKTLAFLIPIMHRIHQERKSKRLDKARTKDGGEKYAGPRALIIAPTKELASQIVNEGRKLCQGTGVRVALMRKGMQIGGRPATADGEYLPGENSQLSDDGLDDEPGQSPAQNKPQVKADVLVSTPLTLLNSITQTDASISPLPSVRFLILDEADVLLDPLFREQTLALWNACTNPLLRISLWSATMGSSIEELTQATISHRHNTLTYAPSTPPPRAPLVRLVVGLKDSAVPHITHNLTYCATEPGKLMALRNLLHPTAPSSNLPPLRPPFLVFTQTIPRALALYSELRYDIPPSAGGPSRIACLHADLSDSAREDIMRRFREAEVWVLITTDLLARGVDFRGLNGVVNYDVPGGAAAYVHRVGRTGRAGRGGGVAVTLYTNEDLGAVRAIANVIAASERLRARKDGVDGAGAERAGEGGVQKWLLDALPSVSKKEKKELKKKGVAVRRVDRQGREKAKARISTKSGWEKQRENNRRGWTGRAGDGKGENGLVGTVANGEDDEDEFEGFG